MSARAAADKNAINLRTPEVMEIYKNQSHYRSEQVDDVNCAGRCRLTAMA